MGKIVKAIVVFSIVVGIAGVVVPAYSQEQTAQQVVNPVSAEIVSVNAESSTIEIKQLKDSVNQIYENQTIAISPEIKILKGEESLELSGLKAGDKIAVKYGLDASGSQKVESISLESSEVMEVK